MTIQNLSDSSQPMSKGPLQQDSKESKDTDFNLRTIVSSRGYDSL